jgi:hypothetical protein
MKSSRPDPKGDSLERPAGKALAYGAVSLLLYVALFVWEDQILRWTTRGGWYFVLPVAIAFLFSFFHGGFTGYFWDVLGIQAKPTEEKKKK